jgi:uncharacterized membrane protein YbhN (UPF0104 family)
LIKAALSLVFLFVLSHFLDVSDLLRLLHGLHWTPILWAVAAQFFIAGINAWKMQLLVANPVVTLSDMMRWNLIKLFVNNLLPSGLGGEVARTIYLGRAVGSMGGSAAVVLCDRLTAQASLSVFSVVALAALAWGPFAPAVWAYGFFFASLAVMAGILGAFGLLSRLNLRGIRKVLGGGPRTAWMEGSGFREFYANLPRRRATFFQILGLSTLGQALHILRLYFLVHAISSTQSPLLLPIALTLASVLSSLPLSIGGVGLSEGGFALAFGLGAEAGAVGFSAALLMRLTSLAPAFVGWLLFLSQKKAAGKSAPTPVTAAAVKAAAINVDVAQPAAEPAFSH